MMNKKTELIFILIFLVGLLGISIQADSSINFLTRGFADTLYCQITGGCTKHYGEIYVKDNTDTMTLNSAAKVQVTAFNMTGVSQNGIIPDPTNDHITINQSGAYLITISAAAANAAAQAHVLDLSAWKNDGATEFNNIHAHRSLAGGSGDIGSISLSGIINGTVNDTIEVWADTSAAANRDVIISDITMSILLLN